MKSKRVLFYSSVNDKNLFNCTGFYVTDIEILRKLNYTVDTSNCLWDFFKFWKYNIAFIYIKKGCYAC